MPRPRKRTVLLRQIAAASNEVQGIGQGSRTLVEIGTSSQPSDTETSGSEYFPTPVKKKTTIESRLLPLPEESPVSHIEGAESTSEGNCFFVMEKAALDKFVEAISKKRVCSTPGCQGILVPSHVERVGLGGGAKVTYSCSGCEYKSLHFNSSTYVLESRRSVVSLSVAVAFVLSGNTHSGYHKALARGLGIPVLSRRRYYDAIEALYRPIKEILDDICQISKDEMQKLPNQLNGSWNKAVTTADGCWLTRGHFSQNFTFIIKNYLNNSLLYYGHLCMRGSDDVVEEPLFPGTAKSAEGHMAKILFQRAKDEGCRVVVNWQDSDSSSAKAVKDVYCDVEIMHCSGHVGRAHANRLSDLKGTKTFSAAYKCKHAEAYPEVATTKCACEGRNHHAGCGCITEGFIRSARINHFLCCIQAETSPDDYATRMRQLGKYHSRDIHCWEGGQCSFHPMRVCTCGNCEDGTELQCAGKTYSSKNVLTCPLHALSYEIECETRAGAAGSVIHPEMGRAHSNLCEAAFTVLPHYRSKNLALHRLTYMTLTNWGLIMSCLSFLITTYGADFNPYIKVYEKLHLPIVNGLTDIWASDMDERQVQMQHKRYPATKKYRNAMKSARKDEQEERKQWTKRQSIIHSYGSQDHDEDLSPQQSQSDDSSMTGTEFQAIVQADQQPGPPGDVVVVTSSRGNTDQPSVKKCRCGSETHVRISHKSCPLNPKNM